MSWTNRVRHSPGSPPLRQVRDAAENLADQAGIAPGKTRVVFGIVTDVAILTAAVTGAALGAVHLWKTLSAKHEQNQHSPEPAVSGDAPPRHRGPHTATVSPDDHDGRQNHSQRSR